MKERTRSEQCRPDSLQFVLYSLCEKKRKERQEKGKTGGRKAGREMKGKNK